MSMKPRVFAPASSITTAITSAVSVASACDCGAR
jgi:hypothetical protein